jgi:6-pyruvoyltetrahydropterin/6-carboxytetrahydropterin synthase
MVGPVNPTNGCLIEHGELSKLVKPVLEKLDHNLLNDIPGLEFPMSETIAEWAWAQLSATVPHLFEITIDRPQSGIRASYQGERK